MTTISSSVFSIEVSDDTYVPDVRLRNKHLKEGCYYGYRECCIHDYSYRAHRKDMTKNQKLSVDILFDCGFSGFVPCPNCADKVLNGKYKKLTDILLMDRRKLPLPDDISLVSKTPIELVKECIFPKEISKTYLRQLKKSKYYREDEHLGYKLYR